MNRGLRIMVVNDEEAMRESLAGWLLQDGYRATTAASGAEALERLQSEPWDLLLVDIKMPGMDGMEMLSQVKALHPEVRAFGPFVAINCGAFSDSLLESELFGHERGVFTGAVKARRSRLEMADGGTLFLDEVGEIPQRMQVDLLRVLEEKIFLRLGGAAPVGSDFRLICATHRDLAAMVASGDFRQDFFYRVNVISLRVPPLRERPEDIELLAEHFLERFARETGKKIEGISRQALQLLRSYPWPGNVRELKNVMERAVVITRRPRIEAEDLTFLQAPGGEALAAVTLQELESNHIRRTLDVHSWNISSAARVLGIDRVTLSRKLRRLGINRPA